MKIYLDYVMIINFFFDFILLMTVSYILKRNAEIKKIIMGAFLGGLSVLLLFLNLNSFEIFLYKLCMSLIMIYVTFGFKSIKFFVRNLVFLYVVSMFLGGGLYFLNNQFSYESIGLVFVNNDYSINLIFIVIIAPLITYFYVRQCKKLKTKYNNFYDVSIFIGENIVKCIGFLDTGNTLVDPLTKKKVILIDKRKSLFSIKKYMKVPYYNASGLSILDCFKPDKVSIDDMEYKNILVGITDLRSTDYDVILNYKLMEG